MSGDNNTGGINLPRLWLLFFRNVNTYRDTSFSKYYKANEYSWWECSPKGKPPIRILPDIKVVKTSVSYEQRRLHSDQTAGSKEDSPLCRNLIWLIKPIVLRQPWPFLVLHKRTYACCIIELMAYIMEIEYRVSYEAESCYYLRQRQWSIRTKEWTSQVIGVYCVLMILNKEIRRPKKSFVCRNRDTLGIWTIMFDWKIFTFAKTKGGRNNYTLPRFNGIQY